MSGVYLILWDEDTRDKSAVLKPGKGGWPHITLVHTGKELPSSELVQIIQRSFPEWAMKSVTLTSACVSSFEEKPGIMRHDVLIALSSVDQAAVQSTRDAYLRPCKNSHKFTMRIPHVTHSSHTALEFAESSAQYLNELHLPRQVLVTGMTIA